MDVLQIIVHLLPTNKWSFSIFNFMKSQYPSRVLKLFIFHKSFDLLNAKTALTRPYRLVSTNYTLSI